MSSQYTAEITALKKQVSDLETKLMLSDVKLDLWMNIARQKEETIKRLRQCNKQPENPRGSHYHSLSWQGKVIFCIRKLKRPLRLQEINGELEIMEAQTEGLKYQGDNFISVVLAKAVKMGRLPPFYGNAKVVWSCYHKWTVFDVLEQLLYGLTQKVRVAQGRHAEPGLLILFADGGYRSKLIEKIKMAFSIDIHIVKRTEKEKFRVLPKRWIIERTFAWLDTNRRNSKDYERHTESSQDISHPAAIRLMIQKY